METSPSTLTFWTQTRMRPVPRFARSHATHRVNHKKKGIILWTVGARSHQTFTFLLSMIKCWTAFASSAGM